MLSTDYGPQGSKRSCQGHSHLPDFGIQVGVV